MNAVVLLGLFACTPGAGDDSNPGQVSGFEPFVAASQLVTAASDSISMVVALFDIEVGCGGWNAGSDGGDMYGESHALYLEFLVDCDDSLSDCAVGTWEGADRVQFSTYNYTDDDGIWQEWMPTDGSFVIDTASPAGITGEFTLTGEDSDRLDGAFDAVTCE